MISNVIFLCIFHLLFSTFFLWILVYSKLIVYVLFFFFFCWDESKVLRFEYVVRSLLIEWRILKTFLLKAVNWSAFISYRSATFVVWMYWKKIEVYYFRIFCCIAYARIFHIIRERGFWTMEKNAFFLI